MEVNEEEITRRKNIETQRDYEGNISNISKEITKEICRNSKNLREENISKHKDILKKEGLHQENCKERVV